MVSNDVIRSEPVEDAVRPVGRPGGSGTFRIHCLGVHKNGFLPVRFNPLTQDAAACFPETPQRSRSRFAPKWQMGNVRQQLPDLPDVLVDIAPHPRRYRCFRGFRFSDRYRDGMFVDGKTNIAYFTYRSVLQIMPLRFQKL